MATDSPQSFVDPLSLAAIRLRRRRLIFILVVLAVALSLGFTGVATWPQAILLLGFAAAGAMATLAPDQDAARTPAGDASTAPAGRLIEGIISGSSRRGDCSRSGRIGRGVEFGGTKNCAIARGRRAAVTGVAQRRSDCCGAPGGGGKQGRAH